MAIKICILVIKRARITIRVLGKLHPIHPTVNFLNSQFPALVLRLNSNLQMIQLSSCDGGSGWV